MVKQPRSRATWAMLLALVIATLALAPAQVAWAREEWKVAVAGDPGDGLDGDPNDGSDGDPTDGEDVRGAGGPDAASPAGDPGDGVVAPMTAGDPGDGDERRLIFDLRLWLAQLVMAAAMGTAK